MYGKPCPKIKPVRLKGNKRTKLKKDVYDRDEGLCQRCGKWLPRTIDGAWHFLLCAHLSHKIPVGKGGSDTMENCEILCFDCHRAVHEEKYE